MWSRPQKKSEAFEIVDCVCVRTITSEAARIADVTHERQVAAAGWISCVTVSRPDENRSVVNVDPGVKPGMTNTDRAGMTNVHRRRRIGRTRARRSARAKI